MNKLERNYMRIIKRLSLALASCLLLGAVLVPSVAVQAQSTNAQSVCDGLVLTGGKCGPDDPNQPGVNSTIKLVINLLSLVVGVVSVIMIIIGGLKYITSQGESANTAGAKNTILYAIIGLVVVALSQIIVKFVLNKVDPTALPTCTTTAQKANPAASGCKL